MGVLGKIIEKIVALLAFMGLPADQATLVSLILLYLLTTGILAVLLFFIIAWRRKRQRVVPPPELES